MCTRSLSEMGAFKNGLLEFLLWHSGLGSSVAAAVAQIQILAWELPCATDVSEKGGEGKGVLWTFHVLDLGLVTEWSGSY